MRYLLKQSRYTDMLRDLDVDIDIYDTGVKNFNEKYDLETTPKYDIEYNEPYENATYNDVAPHDLYQLDDKIQDTINLSETPEYDRIGLFVYYNGKIYTSFSENATHPLIIKTLQEDKTKRQELRTQRSYSYLDDPENRSDDAIAYGHICNNNVCIIDSECNGTRVNNAMLISALKSKFGNCKIYQGEMVGKLDLTKVKRLAKRVDKN